MCNVSISESDHFEFDDEVINSRVYRRALAIARKHSLQQNEEPPDEDLIDLRSVMVQSTNVEEPRVHEDLRSIIFNEPTGTTGTRMHNHKRNDSNPMPPVPELRIILAPELGEEVYTRQEKAATVVTNRRLLLLD